MTINIENIVLSSLFFTIIIFIALPLVIDAVAATLQNESDVRFGDYDSVFTISYVKEFEILQPCYKMRIKWLLNLLLNIQQVHVKHELCFHCRYSLCYLNTYSNKNCSTFFQSTAKAFSVDAFQFLLVTWWLFSNENAFKGSKASYSKGFHPNSRDVFRKHIFDSFSRLLYRCTVRKQIMEEYFQLSTPPTCLHQFSLNTLHWRVLQV